MNRAYRDLVGTRARTTIDSARAMAVVPHAGVKGTIREMLIRDLFRPLFPADVGIGTGQVVAADDRISGQMDMVIYDRRILPAVLYEGTTGLFPVEAVTATVEVKSTLNATELRKAIDAAKDLAQMTFVSGLRDPHTGLAIQHRVERPAAAVFAFESDLAADGKSELERLRELDGAGPDGIRALCVVGRGYWFSIADAWYTAPSTGDLSEVLAFLASYADGLPNIAATRFRPPLADYLFEPDDMPVPGRDAIP